MSAPSFLHLPPTERANYLKRCWQTGRLQEGIREWWYPTRYRFYRWRTEFMKGSQADRLFRFDPSIVVPGLISPEIPAFFSTPVDPQLSRIDDPSSLFSEVDAQLQGTYRLAGDHYERVRDLDLATLSDNEHHHAYHRLYWAARYACAAAFGHGQAEGGLCRDLTLWLTTDWSRDRRVAYPYTTSERIASLAEVAFWVRSGSLKEALRLVVPVKRRVFLDATHLSRNVEYWLAPHNHLLNNARALYVASELLAECHESASWGQLAFQLWDENFAKLVMEDGSFGEETSFYLFMNCRTALEYVLAARKHQHSLPEGLYQRLQRMLQLGNDLLREDGSLPRFGNTSPDHSIRDLWGLMTAARAHGLLAQSPRHPAVTPVTVYYGCNLSRSPSTGDQLLSPSRRDSSDNGDLSGRKSVKSNTTSSGSKDATHRLYQEGGWAFMFRPEINVELVVNGDTHPRTRGHGDSGRGSFELWWRGTILIREPGNPSYTLPTRHWYRSGQGQNVTCVNGLPPGISHEYQERMPDWYCDVQHGSWRTNGSDCIAFRCLGFRRLPNPVEWERQWTWSRPSQLVMLERLEGRGIVQIDSYLHLGDAAWREFSDRRLYELSCCNEPPALARMIIDAPRGTVTTRVPSPFAPEYGVEKQGATVVISGRVQLPIAWSITWEFLN